MNVWEILWSCVPGYVPRARGQHRIERAKVWAGDLIERLAAERRSAVRAKRRLVVA